MHDAATPHIHKKIVWNRQTATEQDPISSSHHDCFNFFFILSYYLSYYYYKDRYIGTLSNNNKYKQTSRKI